MVFLIQTVQNVQMNNSPFKIEVRESLKKKKAHEQMILIADQ